MDFRQLSSDFTSVESRELRVSSIPRCLPAFYKPTRRIVQTAMSTVERRALTVEGKREISPPYTRKLEKALKELLSP